MLGIANPGIVASMQRVAAVPLVERSPVEMAFTRQAVISDYEIMPAALVWHTESFTADTGQFSSFTDNTLSGTISVSGQLTIAAGTTAARSTYLRTAADIGMPQAFVAVDVTARGTTGSPSYDTAIVGVGRDKDNRLEAVWDKDNDLFFLRSIFGGTVTIHPTLALNLSPPLKMGFALVGNYLSLWTSTDGGVTWTLRRSAQAASDPRTVDLTGWKPYCGVSSSGGSSSWTFDNLTAGRFGAVGARDCAWITNEDGSLVDFSGNLRFTATCAEPAGGGNAGVFEVDVSTWTVQQIGVLMMARDSGIWNDLGPHIALLADSTWQHISATWGNNPFAGGALHLRRGVTPTDITSGAHVISGSEITPPSIPSPNGSAYDAMAVKRGGEWWMAYTLVDPRTFAGGNFYAALAKTTDWSSWTAIGNDPSQILNEGTKIVVTNGDLYVVTGGRGEQIIYDDALTQIAAALDVDVPIYNGADTQPWPAIGAWGDEQLLLTFDNTRFGGGTFTWGDIWFYTSPRYV